MAFVDYKEFPELAKQYGVTEGPALIAVDFRNGQHTVAPKQIRVDVRVELTRFLLDIWYNRTIAQPTEEEVEDVIVV